MLLVFVLEAFVPFCAARLYIPVLAEALRVPAEQEKQGSVCLQNPAPGTARTATSQPCNETARPGA